MPSSSNNERRPPHDARRTPIDTSKCSSAKIHIISDINNKNEENFRPVPKFSSKIRLDFYRIRLRPYLFFVKTNMYIQIEESLLLSSRTHHLKIRAMTEASSMMNAQSLWQSHKPALPSGDLSVCYDTTSKLPNTPYLAFSIILYIRHLYKRSAYQRRKRISSPCLMCRFCRFRFIAVLRAFSFAKVARPVTMPSTAAHIQGKMIRQPSSDYANLGIP